VVLAHRWAVAGDIPVLRALMAAAIERLQADLLDPVEIAASHLFMGIDTQLIADGSYAVVEIDGRIAGCGGWSRRATLYGGDHSAGRDAALLDPSIDPARIRAMYTHPDFARRGVGRQVLMLCEEAARTAGFERVELMATLAGERLYRACGYREIERTGSAPVNGVIVPLVRMGKVIAGPI
jgi:GNAT superfamily N-acetyltransferase